MWSKYDRHCEMQGGGSSPLIASKDQLYDLVQFRWNTIFSWFIKSQTILTNVPKPIAYAKKKTLEANNNNLLNHRPVVFQVCENGTYQYQNRLLTRKSK